MNKLRLTAELNAAGPAILTRFSGLCLRTNATPAFAMPKS